MKLAAKKRARLTRAVPAGLFVVGAKAFEAGEPVAIIREYWRNGEGWALVRRADGSVTDVPIVLISDEG